MDPSPSALTDEQAHAVVTFAPDGIVVVDHHGVIVSANARLGALFGYHIDELVGSPIERLVPEALRGEHRSHRDRFGANPSVRTMGVGRTLLGRCKDGSELSVEVGLSPMPGPSGVHVVGIVRDVTEQTALRSANELIQQAIDASRDGVYMFDPKSLVFTYVNQGAVDQTGYTRAQLLSMSPLDMNAEFTEATFRQLLRPLLDGDRESVEFETVHRRVDGGDVPVEVVLQWPAVTAHSRDAAARPLLAIARNIGERKVAEADRRRLARQTALISRLRLLLLGDQPAVPVLTDLCEEVRARGLVDDAGVLDYDEPTDGMVVWGTASPGAGGLGDLGPPITDVVLSGDRERSNFTIRSDDPDLAPGAARLLRRLDASMAVVGGLGPGRGIVLSVSDPQAEEAPTADALVGLVVEVVEAMALARARADAQRVDLLEDRERIATDLHDVVIQRLFAAGMRLQGLLPMLDESARDRVLDVVTELDTTIAEIRETIFALHSRRVAGAALSARIESVVTANEDYLGFRPTLSMRGPVDEVQGRVVDQVIPVLTEVLSNVARHARASTAEVEVTVADDMLELQVSDNGVGIDPDAPRGHGLDNLERRARDLGGACSIGSNTGGGGSMMRWWVPIRA